MKLWVHRSFWLGTILIGLLLGFQNCSGNAESGLQPLPPDDQLNVKLVHFQLLRPINYEVTNIRSDNLDLILMTEKPTVFRIDILDDKTNSLLQRGYLTVSTPGEHRVSVSLNSILRNWKGSWLRLNVSLNGMSPKTRVFGRGFIFFTAGQS